MRENQTGFKKNYSTIDNSFSIHILFELLKLKKQKLYCMFIDFEKAFDNVWRKALWFKLLSHNINGKMFDFIFNMYNHIKSRIVCNDDTSEFFPCANGVRQGENMSAFLFSLYLNDLHDFIDTSNIENLPTISNMFEDKLNILFKLFAILYADDTVLIAENPEELQKQLDRFYIYCNKWNLKINTDKSKLLVFSRGRHKDNYQLRYGNKLIEVVSEFNYLGVIFNRSGSFKTAKQKLVDKATKALYEVLKRGRFHNLSIQCQLDLFDKIVQPILLYGCEIWGFTNTAMIERVHLKFCKLLLHLKQSTPDFMIYGELGRYPMEIQIKTRMISYWSKLISGKETKIAHLFYKLGYNVNQELGGKIEWFENIKNILNNCGISNVWINQYIDNKKWLKARVKLTLIDQFKQNWQATLQSSPKALNYRIYKDELCFENYFKILTIKDAHTLCRFRTCNNYLPIENGRWMNIPRNERICNYCDLKEIGDEFHYILKCKDNLLKDERKRCLKVIHIQNANIISFKQIMNNNKHCFLRKLCSFIRKINKTCSPT